MGEIVWKDIAGYKNKYQVSSNGYVMSLGSETSKTKILKSGKASNGYLTVALCKNGKQKTYCVHRLVAEAFIPNNQKLKCINHKDGNKTNNNVSNLEWCSSSYNNYHSIYTKLNDCSKAVYQYDLQGNLVKEWESQSKASRDLGISQCNISACCRGLYKQARGFIWRFKEI